MKNEILDDIFKDKLRDQLVEGEIIIWEGKPYNGNFVFVFLCLFLLYALYNFFLMKHGSIIPLIMVVSCYLIYSLENGKFIKFHFKKQDLYFITNQRIVFQIKHNHQIQFQSIPFEDITYVSMHPNRWGNDNGTIYLNIRKSSPTSLVLKNSGKNIRPTLDMINHSKDVKKYIQKGIQKEL